MAGGSALTRGLVDAQEEELKDSILLVFANKQDQKGALNAAQVRPLSLSLSIGSCWTPADWD